MREPVIALAILIGGAAAASGIVRFELRGGPDGGPVELVAQEVVRVGSGREILVLREKEGERRLPIPVGAQEAQLLRSGLRRARPGMPGPSPLLASAVHALGGHVALCSIDSVSDDHRFKGHLDIEQGGRTVSLPAPAGETISLALEEGAPIVASASVMERAALTIEEARSLGAALRAKARARDEVAGAPGI